MLIASSLISFTMAFFQSPNRATSDSVQYGASRQRPPLPGVFFSLAADSVILREVGRWSGVLRPSVSTRSASLSSMLPCLGVTRLEDVAVAIGAYISLLRDLAGSLPTPISASDSCISYAYLFPTVRILPRTSRLQCPAIRHEVFCSARRQTSVS